MILSIHQPAYLPWLGYFDKILKSDLFIFLDTVQFEKNSFINRNKIKSQNSSLWLTIPVKTKGHTESSILETEIINNKNWKHKHLQNIYYSYKKAKYFDYLYPKLEILYKKEYLYLSELCFEHLDFWLKEINCETKIVKASNLNMKQKKSQLILEICNYFSSKTYISGALGRDYLEEHSFEKENIEIIYQNYTSPIYEQINGQFISNLSIIDFLMNNNNYEIIKGAK